MKETSILTKTLILVITMLLINGCKKAKEPVTYDLTGNWKVISYNDYETSVRVTKTAENTWLQMHNGDVTISFVPSSHTGGEYSGISVSNGYSGNYTIDQNGGITIGNRLTTKINEPVWGRLFDAIGQAESYEVRSDQLIIFYNQKKKSITFGKN